MEDLQKKLCEASEAQASTSDFVGELKAKEADNLEQIQQLQSELESNKTKIQNINEEVENLKSESEKLREELTKSQQVLYEESSSKKQLEDQLNNLMEEKANAFADLNNQNLKLKTYEDDIETLRSEIKDMEETMESNERKRQEIILEKQRLEETLGEVGADSDKRESELSNHQVFAQQNIFIHKCFFILIKFQTCHILHSFDHLMIL